MVIELIGNSALMIEAASGDLSSVQICMPMVVIATPFVDEVVWAFSEDMMGLTRNSSA